MKRLLSVENIGGRAEYSWLHYGDDGRQKFTVETVQDVDPVFDDVARRRDQPKGKDFRYVGSIPHTVIEEVCKIKAALWGVRKADAFREVMGNKTDRAKMVWADLLQGRDYRRFQAKG